jgi:asparagine synthase (glutamine-hydrolysing)
MTTLLRHRGPDGEGVFLSPDGKVALGNTRLAITDPGISLELPFRSSDSKSVLTFNGEIYDYLHHRNNFDASGSQFVSRTDTEVLLAGLHKYGEEFLHKIDGIWAFAYLNVVENTVLLSRDLMGERHIFYRVIDNEFVFASEPLPILADRGRPEEVDWDSLVTSLRYYSAPPGHTLVRGLERMRPGHNLCIDIGIGWKEYRHRRLHPEKWFDFFNSKPNTDVVVEQFSELMHRNSMRRLPNDVDYMSTLSGGIDSALVCSYASDFGRKPLKTLFGLSSATPAQNYTTELNEYEASCFTSQKLNTQHRQIYLNSQDCVPILKREAANGFDGLFDIGTLAFEMLAREVSAQGLKVLLLSDGPDELCGGYSVDRQAYMTDFLRRRNPLLYTLITVIQASRIGRELMRRVPFIGYTIPPDFSYQPFHFSPIHEAGDRDYFSSIINKTSVFLPECHYGVAPPHTYNDIVGHLDATQVRALSYASYSLPDVFNYRTDKAFMRASIECRLPFQAPEMVEFLLAMPASFRFGDGTVTKAFLRQTVDKFIGPEIANRSKHGFATPLHKTPEVRSQLGIEEVIADSSVFKDLPFRRGTRELLLQGRLPKMLWPFYALSLTYKQLRLGQYVGVEH